MSTGCKVFGLYDEADILVLLQSGAAGDTTSEAVIGFAAGDALRADDATSYALALGNDVAIGIVFNSRVYFTPGLYTAQGHGFVPFQTYYRDPANGKPSTDSDNNERQVLFLPVDADKILIPPQFGDFR